ncbi:MAG: hypothetical protein IKS31_08515 [Clostridia bacterium]|nr:hypothetical protein [Clostridia bacterium]
MIGRIKAHKDRIIVLAALLGLLAAGLYAILAGDTSSVVWERRDPNAAPEHAALNDWHFDRETESFLSDRVPFRRALVALDSGVNALTGRRTQLEAWYVGGAVVEKPVHRTVSDVEQQLSAFAKFADATGKPWLVLTPPSHGWLLRGSMPALMARQYEDETAAYAAMAENDHVVQMPAAFSDDPRRMYYATDHHWTLDGAWQAYLALGERLGYEPLTMENFRITRYEGFHGTTLSSSGLPALWSDTIVCAEPDGPVKLTILNRDGQLETYDRLLFPEKTETVDGYGVYLQDNYGLLMIENDSAPEGTLMVYKDSFANCLLPMLSAHYSRIVVADMRLIKGGYTSIMKQAGKRLRTEDVDPDAILFIYSLADL